MKPGDLVKYRSDKCRPFLPAGGKPGCVFVVSETIARENSTWRPQIGVKLFEVNDGPNDGWILVEALEIVNESR
jgi:hypothetical protein